MSFGLRSAALTTLLGLGMVAGCEGAVGRVRGVDGSVQPERPDGVTPGAGLTDAGGPTGTAPPVGEPTGTTRDAALNQTPAAPLPQDGALAPSPAAPVGRCPVAADAQAEDVSHPTTVVGSGSPASCSSAAFVAAVAKGGVITFDCGPEPVTIVLEQTAKVFNDRGPKVVIDGAGKVTLSGGGTKRILYLNSCDEAQVWTTSHCDNQDHPQLTVQNLTFIDGNASAAGQGLTGGGGAIYAHGGRLKVVNSRFYNNRCAETGADVGGGAIRALFQHDGLPVHVVDSTFGAPDRGNACANGGALSGIDTSYRVVNSSFRFNLALGSGANPARSGTAGGGSGGAIYNDGNRFELSICGSQLEDNRANQEGGAAIFFVSNDRSGSLRLEDSTVQNNLGGRFDNYPGMFVLASGAPTLIDSLVR